MSGLLSAKDVDLSIGGRLILEKINLKIDQGEIVTVVGPNGAGKSSLVRVLIGAHAPSVGIVTRSTNLRMGYVPQKLMIEGQMPLNVRRFMQLSAQKNLNRALALAGAEALLDHEMSTLSGGEAKRVLLAFSLASDPNLLILDEPTAGLDQPAIIAFYALIEKLSHELGIAILLVSHDLNVVMRASDRVICLNRHICCEGTPANVSLAPEFKAMFGDVPMTFYQHAHKHNHDEGICDHE